MRHAFLIIAHTEPELLKTLVSLLDHPGSDIFVHIDAKSDITQFSGIRTKYSKLRFCEKRIDVRWGTDSQIETELLLFETAAAYEYDYYHLLSGIDLPLKPISEIFDFFEKNKGHIFLGAGKAEGHHRIRARYYYRFIHRTFNLPRRLFVFFQKIIRLHRNKDIEIWCGHNWGDFTHDFVSVLLKNREWVWRRFRCSYCGDELYKATFMHEFGYADKDKGTTRHIDWNRGRPYEFTENDIDELKASDKLFVRKITGRHPELVRMLCEHTTTP